MNPNLALTQFFLAAASALSGRPGEAQEARNAGLRLNPNFTVARFRNEPRSENATFLGQRELIYEGLSCQACQKASSGWYGPERHRYVRAHEGVRLSAWGKKSRLPRLVCF